MPSQVQTLDYGASLPRRGGLPLLLIYTAFLTGLLYLISAQAGADAPMRVQPEPDEYHADVAAQLVKANDDPHPAEMVIVLPPADSGLRVNAIGATRIYYMAQYLRYPNRVLIGSDDTIINNEIQLLAAHQPPSALWLRQHDVTALYAVFGGFPPQLQVRPLR